MTTSTRKPAAVRREEIARAVIRIIGERGVTSLTTATLAEEVGLTTGALFRHFASHEEILRHATHYAVQCIEKTFPSKSLPAIERLIDLGRNRVRVLGADAGLAWFVRSEQAQLALPEDAARLLRKLVARSRGFVLCAIRDGAADGTIRNDIKPEILQVPVMGTIHALVGMSGFQKLATRRQASPDRVLEGLVQLLTPPVTPRGRKKNPRSQRR